MVGLPVPKANPSTLVEGGLVATKSAVASADITDGSIADADISSSAAIANYKIAGLGSFVRFLTVETPAFQAGSFQPGLVLFSGAWSIEPVRTQNIRSSTTLSGSQSIDIMCLQAILPFELVS